MVDHGDMSDWYRRWQVQQERERQAGRDAMRAACSRLTELGVTQVTIPYDGYGDGGTVESPRGLRNSEDMELSADVAETLINAAENLLPSGWEINEGSFGELILDVPERSLTRHHSWRVETTEFEEEVIAL